SASHVGLKALAPNQSLTMPVSFVNPCVPYVLAHIGGALRRHARLPSPAKNSWFTRTTDARAGAASEWQEGSARGAVARGRPSDGDRRGTNSCPVSRSDNPSEDTLLVAAALAEPATVGRRRVRRAAARGNAGGSSSLGGTRGPRCGRTSVTVTQAGRTPD